MNRKTRNFLKLAKRNGGCPICKFDNENAFPYYGKAPHISFKRANGKLVVFTAFLEFGSRDNFVPDDTEDGEMGMYFCPRCGYGKPEGHKWKCPGPFWKYRHEMRGFFKE